MTTPRAAVLLAVVLVPLAGCSGSRADAPQAPRGLAVLAAGRGTLWTTQRDAE